MSDTVIRAEGLGKKYCRTLRHSMRYGATDLLRSFFGLPYNLGNLRNGEFWALKDVDFELRRGECLGLIGPNGAGKSTLLKVLNGIMAPDQGKVEVHGRVGALIEVGAGFHPLLTGRENIYVNGSILGLSRKQIERKFDEIVDFSGLEEFIDTPVKHYSSGMYVRLGFAIAAQMKPDILLIDEILAVGDAGFRAKCFDVISQRLRDSAVVLVSHNMVHINRMCSSVILVGNGKAKKFDSSELAIEAYNDLIFESSVNSAMIHEPGDIWARDVCVNGKTGGDKINHNDDVSISFRMNSTVKDKNLSIVLSVLSLEKSPLVYSKHIFSSNDCLKKNCLFELKCNEFNLVPGRYSLALAVLDEDSGEQLLWHYDISPFTVYGDSDHVGVNVLLPGEWCLHQSA